MLLLVVIMTAACVWVEVKIMDSVPWVFNFLSRYRLLSLAFSLVLSVMLGSLFGAVGLIVFAAGVLSTVCVQPVYALKKSGQWDEMLAKYASFKSRLAENKDVYARRTQQGMTMAKIAWKGVCLPFRALFWLWDLVEYTSERMSSSK